MFNITHLIIFNKRLSFLCNDLKERNLDPLLHYELFGKHNNNSTKIIETAPQNYNLDGVGLRNCIFNAHLQIEAPIRLNNVKISGNTCSIGVGSYLSNSNLTGVKTGL